MGGDIGLSVTVPASVAFLERQNDVKLLMVGDEAMQIKKIAWCTGGAQGYFESAIAAGAQAFITGEISEPQAHLARECGVAFFACGHHATERFGVQALASHPMKTDKRGIGDLNVAVTFGGVTFRPGEYVYADNNGIIVSPQPLQMPA